MLAAIAFGRRSAHLGAKQFLVIVLITLIQVGLAVYHMFTMAMPPLN
jgi:hypothetical protein